MALEVAGGWIITDEQIAENLDWAQRERHANAYIQVFWQDMPNGERFYVICVVDLYDELRPTKTVTNDAEFVTRVALNANADIRGWPTLPIIYRDSEGQWDELMHREGHFGTFRPLGTRDQQEAIEKVLALWEQDGERRRGKRLS